ncbi:hypothetical protein [Streptomyces sp. ODS28]|uniref:hypothetical protein n=1 Tax=Streptomyces sp. ODS28 TaxID=3136688 RepID=UPI0031ECB53B
MPEPQHQSEPRAETQGEERLPWRRDESWRRRYPQSRPDMHAGLPHSTLDPYMGQVRQYATLGNAARSSYLTSWQRKMMAAFVIGVAVVAVASVALALWG